MRQGVLLERAGSRPEDEAADRICVTWCQLNLDLVERNIHEALDIFLFAADTPAGILDLYTQLTGRPATVPLWSLGLWVSRAYYKTPE